MARKPDEFMPLNVRKYLGDTMHLSRDQHGAYMLLLMAYWMRGGPLPSNDNELAAIVKASISEWRKLRPVLVSFFTDAGGKWSQKRADEELARARNLTEKKAASGKIGAEKRWQPHGEAMANAMANGEQAPCQTDAPLPIPRREEGSNSPDKSGYPKPKSYSEGFEEFWKAYPTDRNMPKKLALQQWQKLPAEKRAAAIAAIPAFRSYCEKNKSWYRVIYADRFLSQEKFEGYAAEPPLDEAVIAANKDRADKLFNRGKYAEKLA